MEDSFVMKTIEQDGTARMTVCCGDADYRFSVAVVKNETQVEIEHEESHLWRGRIETSNPPDMIYDLLIESAPFREFTAGVM